MQQEENVEDPASTTIAVRKWVDRFELIMSDRHSHQRIELILGQQELFEVMQLLENHSAPRRRSVSNRPGARVANVDVVVCPEGHPFIP